MCYRKCNTINLKITLQSGSRCIVQFSQILLPAKNGYRYKDSAVRGWPGRREELYSSVDRRQEYHVRLWNAHGLPGSYAVEIPSISTFRHLPQVPDHRYQTVCTYSLCVQTLLKNSSSHHYSCGSIDPYSIYVLCSIPGQNIAKRTEEANLASSTISREEIINLRKEAEIGLHQHPLLSST